jgi:hypothetical protein
MAEEMNPVDDVDKTIEKLHIATKPKSDKNILDNAYKALEKTSKAPSSESARHIHHKIFSNKIKLATIAGMIILILILFLKGLNSTKNDIGRIDTAFTKVGNVCVMNYYTDSTESYEQQWLSTSLNVVILKWLEDNKTHLALLDLSNKVKMQTHSSSNTIQTEPLTDSMLDGIEKEMIQNTGLVKYFLHEIPNDASWKHVDDPEVTAQNTDTKTLQLLWQHESLVPGQMTYRKLLIFSEIKTNLPLKVEWYAKSRPDEQYSLEIYTLFSYPKKEEIQSIIRTAFDPAHRQPEYIGSTE